MIEAGAFDDVDCAMMTHPTGSDILYPSVLAIQEVVVKFHGKNAHAAGNPEDGVNALDAVIQVSATAAAAAATFSLLLLLLLLLLQHWQ